MKTSEDLFQLVKSLDQSEKRYFKVFSAMHSKNADSNNYVKLFDAIEKQSIQQKTYDEEAVKKQFGEAKFTKQFHVAKNYLYNNILKSLRLYNSEKSKVKELGGLITDIEILYEKSLFSQCKKVIEKAKKIAYRYERYSELLEILYLEKSIARTEVYEGWTEEELNKLYLEQEEAIAKLKNINDYWNLSYKSFFIRKKHGALRDKNELEVFNNLFSNPYLLSEDKAVTYISKTLYFGLKGLYYLTNKDYQNLYAVCNSLIQLIEDTPHMFRPDNYINALNNLLLVQIELEKFSEAFETIKKLRGVEVESEKNRAMIFARSYDTEINIYLRTGDFGNGTKIVREIEEGFGKFKKYIDKETEILFYYNIAYLYFGNKDFSQALENVNKILNAKELDLREDIRSYAHILNLFIHYEMNNYELIEYIIRSAQRFLSAHKNLRQLESYVLSFIKKLINADSEKDKALLYDEMKYKMNEMKSDINSAKALEYFDVISWLESKIRKTDLAVILKEKLRA